MRNTDFKSEIQNPKSKIERERLVNEHAPLVKFIAQRIAMKLPPNVAMDDLISTGVLGLLDAIDKYDPARDVKFSTYAQFRIRGAIMDSLRENDWVPRSVRSKAGEVGSVYESLEKKLGRPATEAEAAKEMGMDIEGFMEMLGEVSCGAMLSIEDLSFTSDDLNLLDIVADPKGADQQAILGSMELKSALGKAIDLLPEKERLVVTLYYYEDLTMKEAGVVLNLTESRVCQLHTQAMLRLRGKMKGKV